MLVTAVATNAPVILSQGATQGIYRWQVSMPLLVIYQDPNTQAKQNLLVTMDIVRTKEFIGTRGLGISSFIAALDKTAAPEPQQNTQQNTQQ